MKKYQSSNHREPNPHTNKKPCIKCGSTERYSTYPYQCKICQRKAANKRHVDMAIAEQGDKHANTTSTCTLRTKPGG